MVGYTTWIHHGESMRPSETTSGPSSQFEEYVDSDEMDEMLLEGFGMYDTRTLGEEQESEDDLDDDDEEYYRLDDIKKRIRADPSLIGEEARDGDLYSPIFPKEKKGRPSGLGLLVGGVASERLAQVEAELHAAKQENVELRHVVHTLVANQTSIMAKSERMEEQYNELKSLIIASRGSVEMGGIPEKELPNKDPSKDLETMNAEEHATSLSYATKASEAMAAPKHLDKVKANQLESKKTKSTLPSLVHVPKLMKTKKTQHKKPVIFQTPIQKGPKDGLEDIIKCGMEVSLTSPNSTSVVAMGTIQKTDRKAKATDGQPLADCVEVLVNIVLKETTELPRAQGKTNKLGNAQARCIPWPRKNIMQTDDTTLLHSKVSSVCSQMSVNNSENVDPNKITTGTQVTKHQTDCRTLEGVVRNTLKRKKVFETTKMKKGIQAICPTTENNILMYNYTFLHACLCNLVTLLRTFFALVDA
ncbi:hypothetical protein ZWY2020_031404 [Hordeum vulgare]|nr:hypothetical protein ZWY2020_031404 [Hordeum vulgare]